MVSSNAERDRVWWFVLVLAAFVLAWVVASIFVGVAGASGGRATLGVSVPSRSLSVSHDWVELAGGRPCNAGPAVPGHGCELASDDSETSYYKSSYAPCNGAEWWGVALDGPAYIHLVGGEQGSQYLRGLVVEGWSGEPDAEWVALGMVFGLSEAFIVNTDPSLAVVAVRVRPAHTDPAYCASGWELPYIVVWGQYVGVQPEPTVMVPPTVAPGSGKGGGVTPAPTPTICLGCGADRGGGEIVRARGPGVGRVQLIELAGEQPCEANSEVVGHECEYANDPDEFTYYQDQSFPCSGDEWWSVELSSPAYVSLVGGSQGEFFASELAVDGYDVVADDWAVIGSWGPGGEDFTINTDDSLLVSHIRLRILNFDTGDCEGWQVRSISVWGTIPVVPTSTNTPTATRTNTPGPTVTPGGPTLTPTNTPTTGVAPTATRTNTPTATGTPSCGRVDDPCYVQVQLPLIEVSGGGALLGLIIFYGLIYPFVHWSTRIVLGMALLFSVGAFVVTGMYGYLYGFVVLAMVVTPLTHITVWVQEWGKR